MLVITFQIIMLNIFALKDKYPLSLWKFFSQKISPAQPQLLNINF